MTNPSSLECDTSSRAAFVIQIKKELAQKTRDQARDNDEESKIGKKRARSCRPAQLNQAQFATQALPENRPLVNNDEKSPFDIDSESDDVEEKPQMKRQRV